MNGTLLHAGDTALVIEFGRTIDRAISARVMQLEAALKSARIKGVTETTPTFCSLMVHFDPTVIGWRALSAAIERTQAQCRADGELHSGVVARSWKIPVCYEAEYAPDLATVAERIGQTPQAVIDLHCNRSYFAYMVAGFPGYPHLGDIDETIRLPRLAEPRTSVPAGSVAIANRLTAVYPVATPGGWYLIGRTPVRLFDPCRERPALISPGDLVAFERVDEASFEQLSLESAHSDFDPDRLLIEGGSA